MHDSRAPRAPCDLCWRLLAASVGGYALCWTLFVACCVWLPFGKATVWYLTAQFAPLPFVGVLLWAFASRSPARALAVPAALSLAAGLVALAGGLR